MECKCIELSKLERIPSQVMNEYSDDHLKIVSLDKVAWKTIYVCPETGIRFLEESVPGYKNRIYVSKWSVVEVPE